MKSKFEEQLKAALQTDRIQFDPEPLPGHEERFEMRLLQKKEDLKIKKMPRWPIIGLAAAALIGFIVTIVVSEMKKSDDFAGFAKLSDVSEEMAATESYYTGRLQLDRNNLNTQDQNIAKFLTDLKKLEEEYKMLEVSLSKNFQNERITNAMVNNYKFRLRLMEQLQKYIEIQNKINNDHNEKQAS